MNETKKKRNKKEEVKEVLKRGKRVNLHNLKSTG